LFGITVIDFGQYLAGPGTAMILADQGAHVIRVERPNGPTLDGPASDVLNRGKKRIVLDLKQAQDAAAARELVARADVVIENFRPGVMKRLGLGPDELMRRHPRLIYLSLPGFSRDDLPMSGIPAWEGVISAAMGQFTDMGLNRVLMGVQASYSPLTLASAYASVFGAMSVVLALRARGHHGCGDFIEVPLAASLMEALAYNSMRVDGMPERYTSLREREIARRRATGLPMNLTHGQLQSFLDPFYRTYVCRDGRPFYVVSVSHVTHAERALKVLGIWDELVAAGVPRGDPYLPIRDWPNGVDSTIKAYPVTEPWASRISGRMAQAFLTKDSAEWERLFGEAGAPGAAHRTTQEWLQSQHPREAGLLIESAHERYGRLLQPGPLAWLVGCPPVVGGTITRDAGADGTAASPIVSRSPPGPQTPSAGGDPPSAPWLYGVTILDMTNVIAGPTIAGSLSRFGARVIKIDAVKPTFDPWNTIVMGIYSNRGKESVLVDVKTAKGREVLKRLIERVDIITINGSCRQLPALGLDFDDIQRINPRAILCHLDAFGGTGQGPRSEYPGYDDLVQASTGIMERFGGGLDSVEEHAHFGTIDVLAGLCAALAACLALYRRETTGKGDVARSSLAAAGQWIQSRFMYDFTGRPPFNEPRGPSARGESPFYRCYQASDGWFFLAVRQDLESAVKERLVADASAEPSALEALLEATFKGGSVESWQQRLCHLNVAVQPLDSLSAVRAASLANATPAQTVTFARDMAHPSGYVVEHINPTAIRPERAGIVTSHAAPKYGADTRRVMNELGYSEDDVARMAAEHVIAEGWSPEYLPN